MVKISFTKDWDTTKLVFEFFDGNETKVLKPVYNKYEVVINEKILGRFGELTIKYTGNSGAAYFNTFLVSGKKSFIVYKNKIDLQENPLAKPETLNALSLIDCAASKRLQRILIPLNKAFDSIYAEINKLEEPNDTLNLAFTRIDSLILAAELEFIQKNGSDYYCFWLFKERVKGLFGYIKASKLIEIFNKSFQTNLKSSYAGKKLLSLLRGWNAIETSGKAPDFTGIDVLGDTVSLSKYSGKYVLLDFWASWCKPCIEGIPFLKNLRNKFSVTELEIISVSYDNDTAAAKRVINSFGMNWRNIVNDKEIISKYGNGPIPAFYLLDVSGKILFSRFLHSEAQVMEYLISKLKR